MTDPTRDAPLSANGRAAGRDDATPADPSPAGTSASSAPVAVHRMAQAAHEAVDRLEQALGTGSERMMDWQQEYGELARDRVRASPLAAVGIAFGVGLVVSRLFMR